MNHDVEKALRKRALGYRTQETVVEYAEEDGQWKVKKKKVTSRHVPPEIAAAKVLLECKGEEFSSMSDEALEREREKLLCELQSLEEGTKGK